MVPLGLGHALQIESGLFQGSNVVTPFILVH